MDGSLFFYYQNCQSIIKPWPNCESKFPIQFIIFSDHSFYLYFFMVGFGERDAFFYESKNCQKYIIDSRKDKNQKKYKFKKTIDQFKNCREALFSEQLFNSSSGWKDGPCTILL